MGPPDPHALAMSVAIVDKNPWMAVQQFSKRVHAVTNGGDTVKMKRQKLVKLVDLAGSVIAPYSPCRAGCSHCCHIACVIDQAEADRIAAVTGRARVVIPLRHPDDMDHLRSTYKGVPCPFLLDDQCSIYAHRPMACRAHHTLNKDNGQCQLSVPSEESNVGEFNLKAPQFAMAFLSLEQGQGIGDIREFFPG